MTNFQQGMQKFKYAYFMLRLILIQYLMEFMLILLPGQDKVSSTDSLLKTLYIIDDLGNSLVDLHPKE